MVTEDSSLFEQLRDVTQRIGVIIAAIQIARRSRFRQEWWQRYFRPFKPHGFTD